MKLTRKQINILLILAVLTVVLFIGIFFLPHITGGSSVEPDPPPVIVPPAHDRFRHPREAASEHLSWELTLGGTGNEQVVAAFGLGEELIIFGNTTSTDFDFDGTNANAAGSFFVMLLNLNGQPIAYRAHAGTLEQVIMISNPREGFLLVVNTATESFIIETNLFATDLLEGDKRRSDCLRNAAHERIVYLYIDDFALYGDRTPAHLPREIYHAVLEAVDVLDGFRRLRVAVLCASLEVQYERFFTSTQSVEFVAAYAKLGEFVLFGTLIGGNNTSRLVGFRWDRVAPTRSFTPLLMQGVQNYSLQGMIPVGADEFAALIRLPTGVHQIVWFYNFFSATPRIHTIELSGESAQKAVILGGGQNRFYVFEIDLLGNGILYRFSISTMRILDEMPLVEFNYLTTLTAHLPTNAGHGTVFIGTTATHTVIIGTDSMGTTNTRLIEGIKNVRFIIRENENIGGVIIVGEIEESSPNAYQHFGGSDVWIARVG